VDGCVRVGNCSSEKGIAEIVNIYGLGNALYFTGFFRNGNIRNGQQQQQLPVSTLANGKCRHACFNAKQCPWHELRHDFCNELVNPVPGRVRGDEDTVQKEDHKQKKAK
jgi:hypothetical protein